METSLQPGMSAARVSSMSTLWRSDGILSTGTFPAFLARLASRYPKAKPGGFYGHFRGIYNPDELNGLLASKFIEAAHAEGASLGGNMYPLWQEKFNQKKH